MVKKISNMYELITEENMNLVLNYDFTTDYYKEILKQINEHGSSNLSLDYNLSPLENVKRITRKHVDIYYSEKEILAGYYIYNRVYINNKLPDSQQIVTLIHELTHHIYAEIFEIWLLDIFDVEKSSIIGSFVMFMLNNSIENRAANEYFSYIVEGRFTPVKYHNYIAFIQLLIDLNIDVEKYKNLFIFINEISDDVTLILKSVIDSELQKKIDIQFELDEIEPLNQELIFDYADKHFTVEEVIEIIKEMVYFIFDYFINGEGNIDELEDYVHKFDK